MKHVVNLCCALLMSISSTAVFADTPLQIATPEDARPSLIAAQKILTVAYARIGVPVNFVKLPGVRGLMQAEAGQLDGILLRLTNEADSHLVPAKVVIASEDVVVFTVNKHFAVTGFDSLRPYVIGHIAGVKALEKVLKDAKTEPAPNLESLFRKLAAGRTEVAIDSRNALCVAKKLGLDEIHIIEPALFQPQGMHYLHNKNAALIPKLEAALQQMQKEGLIKKLQDEALASYMAVCT